MAIVIDYCIFQITLFLVTHISVIVYLKGKCRQTQGMKDAYHQIPMGY